MYRMTLGQVVATAPTIGSQVEDFTYKNTRFTLFDVGGQTSLRASWGAYLTGASAVIFVVDATDQARMSLAKEELHHLVATDLGSGVYVLVFANKQDMSTALSPAQVSSALALPSLPVSCHIQPSSATTGAGVLDGLDWLAAQLGSG